MPFILNKNREIEDFCELLRKTEQFDKLEIKILSAMFLLEKNKQPKSCASAIAEKAEMSVTNTYKYLYSLQQKGLVESDSGKNKIFWLARTNPFERLFSHLSKEYIEKKEVFSKLKDVYEKIVSGKDVWMGKQVFERYSNSEDFINKASLIMDIAQKEIMIMAEDIEDDFILVDSMKRAIWRGIKIRIMNSNIPEEKIALLKKIGAELRFMDRIVQPFTMVADGRHGITVEMKGNPRQNTEICGTWFLNHETDYKKKFDALWEKAGSMV